MSIFPSQPPSKRSKPASRKPQKSTVFSSKSTAGTSDGGVLPRQRKATSQKPNRGIGLPIAAVIAVIVLVAAIIVIAVIVSGQQRTVGPTGEPTSSNATVIAQNATSSGSASTVTTTGQNSPSSRLATSPATTAATVPVQPTASATATITPSATPVPPSPTPTEDMMTVANSIVTGVGQVAASNQASSSRIYIFEEKHNSRVGRLEIAIMLNRLYEKYALRHIGLEGYFVSEGVLDARWFNTTLNASMPPPDSQAIAVALTASGEINSAELMAMLYPDWQVHGIEQESEYNNPLPEDAVASPIIYLSEIAAAGMTPAQISHANSLITNRQSQAATEYIVNNDPWTKKIYQQVTGKTDVLSSETWLQILGDLKTHAASVKANVTPDDQNALQRLTDFYSIASQRSQTMADNMIRLAQQFPEAPVAMIIGAGHTDKVTELFKAAHIAYVVIDNNALVKGQSDLPYQAYVRKMAGQSAFSAGYLGALLDGRMMPREVITQIWFQDETRILALTAALAHAALSSEAEPFVQPVSAFQAQNPSTVVDQIGKIGSDVIFRVTIPDKNNKSIIFWVRTRANPDQAKNQPLIETRLLDAIAAIEAEDPLDYTQAEPVSSVPRLYRLSLDTVAKFSMDEAVIRASTLDK